MGEMNHQDKKAQKGNLKKEKEEKEKEKQNPARAVCYYTTERKRKNRILRVCYILSCVFAINTDKIVTYSDKDCSLKKKKDANTE